MTEPNSVYLDIDGHEIHVTDWGDPARPAIVLWHGLSRTGGDFDTLARHLAPRYRVICPDTIGRGLSSWSRDPDRDYQLPIYAAQAGALLDRLGVERCDWVGTSMGGLIGMLASVGPLAGRIGRLVLNDIGPVIDPVALARIRDYVTLTPSFAGVPALEAFLRVVNRPFGALTDAEWRRIAETSARRRDDGTLTLHYDPAVMRVFAEQTGGGDLWPVWDALKGPVLVLRGAESDILLPDIAQAMTIRGPGARLVTLPGCGHAPMLNIPDQIAVLDAFLGG